jgi:hypothetical protein
VKSVQTTVLALVDGQTVCVPPRTQSAPSFSPLFSARLASAWQYTYGLSVNDVLALNNAFSHFRLMSEQSLPMGFVWGLQIYSPES